VAELEGTLTDDAIYQQRRRLCDLSFLRQPYRRPDGKVGYRCPAEPIASYVAKGGTEEDAKGRKCLCNALIANVGMPQRLPDGTDEKCLITLGDDLAEVSRFCPDGKVEFTAADVVRVLLGDPA
jgi:nitronate monooxygenase